MLKWKEVAGLAYLWLVSGAMANTDAELAAERGRQADEFSPDHYRFCIEQAPGGQGDPVLCPRASTDNDMNGATGKYVH